MRVPLDWLREYVDPGLTAKELGQRLTMSGSAFNQSVAATIGPPSAPRIWLTYGTRGVLASGWSRFQRSTSSASRRSNGNDGALYTSAATPHRSARRSSAAMT